MGELIEILVQQNEVQFGSQSGAGSLKANEAKATIWYFLHNKNSTYRMSPKTFND
jgi:hypothetical protein